MSDFYQKGMITTLHNITDRPVEEMEAELTNFAQTRPMTLVLPSLFSELEGPALGHIVEELSKVHYLGQVVIGLDRADKEQFEYARSYFSKLPQRHRILWNDGPRLKAIDQELKDKDLSPMEPGKGRNVWFCFGYTLSTFNTEVVGLHDCDILTYDRSMLARLFYPVANPGFSYVFNKGYYPRVADGQLNGRVARLLVKPLLLALKKVCGPIEYLEYLDSFRYPLAGEFAMRASVLPDLRIPADWGLEIGVLSEIRRNYSTKVICQTDISDAYDHKHQPLSQEDASTGLSRMSIDISKAIYRKLATDGQILSMETFRTIKATYYREALDLIEMYYNDAMMNGLTTDRHKEEQAVELFAANIMEAGQTYLENPMETPFIPSWSRVHSAMPGLLSRLNKAVEADNA